jgi:hypothetical protein
MSRQALHGNVQMHIEHSKHADHPNASLYCIFLAFSKASSMVPTM